MASSDLIKTVVQKLQAGCVIPAHPLALTPDLKIDTRCQRALTRYYLDAGAGGLAVGVHTTQFAIHDPQVGLYKPVLELAADTANTHGGQAQEEPILIAGLVGPTAQAVQEAEMARALGFHIGLLSLTALAGQSNQALIDHARQVAEVIPLMGFYLQPAISGMVLDRAFWQALVEIPALVAIKVAPFDRYKTLDVLQAVAESGRAQELALYTGNDDTIIQDLLTVYQFNVSGRTVSLRMTGGLLGQWACWTQQAVKILQRIGAIHAQQMPIPPDLLTLGAQLTLANRAIFDVDHGFRGCIPGISYVLQQQGLVRGTMTLDPEEALSPGQMQAIDRIIEAHPQLTDNDFVQQHLDCWLSN
ncbi:MAG: dihydrodipicolinate synthase family protein [Phycisphaerae bacterium]|nr:dihydrodipicolinate synthase family protein [Phycisphaerae bacterium]